MISYDQAGDFYYEFIQRGLAVPQSMFHLAINAVLELVGEVKSKDVCDMACGEGTLMRRLAQLGARVTGVDMSSNLLTHARRQSAEASLTLTYIQDDAQTLSTITTHSFDVVTCNLALMDIPDFALVFASVWRVLRPGGRFVFSVLHPCFETPFHTPESQILFEPNGDFEAYIVRRYTSEGYWHSGGTGMRGTFGAHHRMLSTYLNGVLDAGFALRRFIEPHLPSGDYTEISHQINSRVPQVLVVSSVKPAQLRYSRARNHHDTSHSHHRRADGPGPAPARCGHGPERHSLRRAASTTARPRPHHHRQRQPARAVAGERTF
jgi:SAM-dependent methyltransferase